MSSIARRTGAAVGVLLILLGVFWTGRESSHGSLSVFWEHWWCPLPLAIVVLGVVSIVVAHAGAPQPPEATPQRWPHLGPGSPPRRCTSRLRLPGCPARKATGEPSCLVRTGVGSGPCEYGGGNGREDFDPC